MGRHLPYVLFLLGSVCFMAGTVLLWLREFK